MNADLKLVSSWLIANKLTPNVIKTVYMVVGSRQRLATLEGDLKLQIDGTSLKKGTIKLPNVLVSKWTKILHGKNTQSILFRKLRVIYISILHKVAPILSLDNKIAIFRSIIEPYFNYCCLVWDGFSKTLSSSRDCKIERPVL